MKSVIPLLICCVLGGIIGWVFAAPTLDSKSVVVAASKERSSPRDVNLRGGSSSAVVLNEDAPEFERLIAVALMGDQPLRGSFAEQLEELSKIEDWTTRSQALATVIRKWLLVAPRDAFSHVMKENDPWRSPIFSIFFTEWVKLDLDAAIDAVKEMEKGSHLQSTTLYHMMREIADESPEKALELMHLGERMDVTVLEAVARLDPLKAVAEARNLSTQREQQRAIQTVVEEWAKSDPDAALKFVNEDTGNRDLLIRKIARTIGETDREKAIAVIDEHLKGSEADEARKQVLEDWAVDEPLEAMAYFNTLPNADNLSDLRANLAGNLVKSGHAEEALNVLHGSKQPEHVASGLFRAWAQEDWEGAAAAAMNLDDLLTRGTAAQGMLETISTSKLASDEKGKWTEALVQVIAESPRGQSGYLDLNSQHLHTETLGRILNQHPQMVKNSVSNLFETLVQRDPEKAQVLFDSLENEELRDRALQPMAAKMAEESPVEVADWVSSLPEGKGKEYAFGNVANTWTRSDPEAVQAWIEKLEPSVARDEAIGQYVKINAGRDPASALALAQEVSVEEKRNQIVQSSLEAWLTTDFESALKGIAEMDLPEAVAEKIAAAAKREEVWQRLSAPAEEVGK